MSNITFDFKERYDSFSQFYKDWVRVYEQHKNEYGDSEAGRVVDLTKIKEYWKTLPMGDVTVPIVFDDESDVEYLIQMTKMTEEFPIEYDKIRLTPKSIGNNDESPLETSINIAYDWVE